jgi:biotin carboxyl carrier protein
LAIDPSTVFVSYSREDGEFVDRLAADLMDKGASIWLDQLDIEGGQLWDKAVQDALGNCQRVLVILSPAAVESKSVMDELSFALEENKTVIPILYRDCTLPFRVRRLQRIDFRENYERALAALLDNLKLARPIETSAPPVSPDRAASATQVSPTVFDITDLLRLVSVVFRPLEKDTKVATLEKWLKEPGDRVRKGEPLVTVRSEEYYLPVEIAAPDSGTLRKVIVAAGTQLSDGTLLGYIFRDK